jgi:MIP family channel proteins
MTTTQPTSLRPADDVEAQTQYRGGAFRQPQSLAEQHRVTAATFAGEALASFLLIAIGCGSVILFKLQVGPKDFPDLLAIAIAWAFAVLAIVYAFGHVSGAHCNPSVTLGLAVTRKFPWRAVPWYLAAQAIGMAAAIALLWAAFGDAAKVPTIALGGALPGKGTTGLGVAACEFVITFLLLLVVMATATDERAESPAVGLGVGLTVGGLVLAAATVSGTSLNGMRSLMPMIFSGHWNDWLAYMIAPALGGMVGALTYEHLVRPGRPPEPAGAVEEHARGTLE